jgi:pimeloyl-ACP methyl ester carboxylesterase
MPLISANRIDLYYEESGSGEPLLFLPPTGWPGSVWDLEQVPYFRDHYRVITFDQRGVGLSDKPDDQYTTELLARDALALLEALDAMPAHVFGSSVGGQTAQIMALEKPQSIRCLILAGSNPGRPSDAPGLPLGLVVGMVTHGYGEGYWMHHLADSDFPFSPAFRAGHPEKLQALAHTSRRASRRSYCTCGTSSLGRCMIRRRDLATSAYRRWSWSALRIKAARSPRSRTWMCPERWLPGSRTPSWRWCRAHHLFAWEEPGETNRLALELLQRH